MSEYVLEINSLNFSYNSSLILENIDFKLKKNDFCAILGPNGGGKTTLAKLICGILKPDSGTIKINGKNITKISPDIGYIPQNIMAFEDFPSSCLDIVLSGNIKQSKWGFSYSRSFIDKAMDKMRLMMIDDLAKKRFSDLSGGQKQRILISRALLSEPDILILDEPTSSVDMENRTKLYQILRELNKDMTIILVSHDISIVLQYVKSVCCVNKTLFYHPSPDINQEMLLKTYHCPVEIISSHTHYRPLKSHNND